VNVKSIKEHTSFSIAIKNLSGIKTTKN